MLLSEHFSLSEMLASETAEKHHIPNTPLKRHITALQNLAVRCLEPTRQHFGMPIQVTSGYRCPQLNAAVKGAANSQHLAGEAADITIPRRQWPFCYTSSEQIARLLFTWMKDNVDLDQLILEHSIAVSHGGFMCPAASTTAATATISSRSKTAKPPFLNRLSTR